MATLAAKAGAEAEATAAVPNENPPAAAGFSPVALGVPPTVEPKVKPPLAGVGAVVALPEAAGPPNPNDGVAPEAPVAVPVPAAAAPPNEKPPPADVPAAAPVDAAVAPKPPKAGLEAGATLDDAAVAPPKLNPEPVGALPEVATLAAEAGAEAEATAAVPTVSPKENPPAAAGFPAEDVLQRAEASEAEPDATPKAKPPLAGFGAAVVAVSAADADAAPKAKPPLAGGKAVAAVSPEDEDPAVATSSSFLSGSESISAILLRFSWSSKKTDRHSGTAMTRAVDAAAPVFCNPSLDRRESLAASPPSRARLRCRRA